MTFKRVLRTSLAAALLGLAAQALASPTIELKDGSRIQGEIQGLDNGTYTVRSPTLGTVHVRQTDIAQIVYDGASASTAAPAAGRAAHDDALAAEIQGLEKRLAEDPATLQAIMSLQSDPQIQALLADPAIAKAIQEGDYLSLLGNPKIRALENNENLKQILEQQHAH